MTLHNKEVVGIPTLGQAAALKAPAFIRTPEGMVAIDLAPLQSELAACGRLERHEIARAVAYWLAVRCKLGYEFVARIVEVSTPQDNIDWKVPQWLIMGIHAYTGTCVQHST